MGKMLLGFAAIAACLVTTPAAAGGPDAFGGGDREFVGPNGFGFGDNGHNRRRRGDDQIGIWVNSGEWAQYNNRAFESDSFNGWWHDRPDRAYPAWVRTNQMMQNCRLYWAGGGWRC